MEFPKVKILNFGVKLSRSLLNWNNKMFPLFEPFTHSYQNTIPRKFTTFRSVEARKKKPRLKYRFLMEKTDRINLLGSFSSFWVHKLTSLYSVWCHFFSEHQKWTLVSYQNVYRVVTERLWTIFNLIRTWIRIICELLHKRCQMSCACACLRNRIMQIEWKKG